MIGLIGMLGREREDLLEGGLRKWLGFDTWVTYDNVGVVFCSALGIIVYRLIGKKLDNIRYSYLHVS
jgi:hypothetical protein